MAEKQAFGPLDDSVPFSSLAHAGSVIDAAQCGAVPTKTVAIGIRCHGACVITCVLANGQTRNLDFVDGETRAVMVRKITAVVSGSPWPLEMLF